MHKSTHLQRQQIFPPHLWTISTTMLPRTTAIAVHQPKWSMSLACQQISQRKISLHICHHMVTLLIPRSLNLMAKSRSFYSLKMRMKPQKLLSASMPVNCRIAIFDLPFQIWLQCSDFGISLSLHWEYEPQFW